MSTAKLHVKKGDTVIILSGKNKGKKGKVLSCLPTEGKVLVEGINIVKKHTRPTQKSPQGGIQEKEAPLHSSKVMLVCPSCKEAARVSKKSMTAGEKARKCKNCGETIDR
ncbi:MAG: 50S ribosomal protein L24 [Firmicutes bacterium HGW-Firmicutes-13]|nr:MAG: 50S ribosomal protein L24 [Firmicutes bacterium HGW-Firmicutes-13]